MNANSFLLCQLLLLISICVAMNKEKTIGDGGPLSAAGLRKKIASSRSLTTPNLNTINGMLRSGARLSGEGSGESPLSKLSSSDLSKRSSSLSKLSSSELTKKAKSEFPPISAGSGSKAEAATSAKGKTIVSDKNGPLGPVVFITGANRGIGKGVLEELCQMDGVNVIISTFRTTNLETEATARRYSNESGKIVKIIPMEMGEKEQILRGIHILNRELQTLVAQGKIQRPMINTVIHNAGVMDSIEDNIGVHPLHIDYDVYLKHLKVNALAPSFITSQINPLLYASEQPPRVIFISSTVSSMNLFFGVRSTQTVAYPMSKTATNSYVKYMSDVKKDIASQGDAKKDNEMLVDALLKQYAANDEWTRFVETSFQNYLSGAAARGENANGDRLYLANPQFKSYLTRYVRQIPKPERLTRGWIMISLCPGWVATDMGNKAKSGAGDSPTAMKQASENVLLAITKMTMADSGTFHSLYEKFPNPKNKGHQIPF